MFVLQTVCWFEYRGVKRFIYEIPVSLGCGKNENNICYSDYYSFACFSKNSQVNAVDRCVFYSVILER